jgi:hypothetical protein
MVAVVPEEKNLLVYYKNGVATALLKGHTIHISAEG